MKDTIAQNVRSLLSRLPPDVLLVAAAKTRSSDEVRAALDAGIRAVGHNYVQEAEAMQAAFGQQEIRKTPRPRWHLIGHLQRNKAKMAAGLFDMIETLDSVRLAEALDRHCADIGKVMPVLIEINSGRESNKTGLDPDMAEPVVREMARCENLRIQGLMTMGPRSGDPEEARPYFRLTKSLFDEFLSKPIENVEMKYLSMGMSNSYRVAIQEGANTVRIGTALFGPRSETS